MKIDAVGVVAAMPQEIAPLLRRIGSCRKERLEGCNLYRFELAGVPVSLIESGMGPRHAAQATEVLIRHCKPSALFNFGFGGAVLPGLEVGDLVLAERIFFLERGMLTELPLPDARYLRHVEQALADGSPRLQQGSFVTAAQITGKAELAGQLPRGLVNPVLEMETAALIRVAAAAGLPVLALRGISDAAGEELGFSLEEFCDHELRIRLPRVLATVARKPWIIPQLIRLAGNTKRAGEQLATGVHRALEAMVQVDIDAEGF
jgi:adenosylhomocysteine nucleosidase